MDHLQFLKEAASKGGRNRAKKLSKRRRREIAIKANGARWANKSHN